jgi:hypothetical protein
MGDNTTDDGGLGDQPAEEVQGEAASGRRTREDLKELVLNAGVEVLERDGLGLSIGSLTYAKVFAYIQENYGITVSRASVHERIWESRDEFRNAVVARAMAYSSTEVLEPVTENLNELLGGLELSTRDGRDQAVRDLLRHALSLNWEFAMGSTAARRQIAVKAMCLTEADPDLVDRVRSVLQAQLEARRDDFTGRFRAAIEAFRLEVNPALGLTADEALFLVERQVSRLAAATMLDAAVEPDEPQTVTVTTPGAQPEEWTPMMLSVYAMISFIFHERRDGTGAS